MVCPRLSRLSLALVLRELTTSVPVFADGFPCDRSIATIVCWGGQNYSEVGWYEDIGLSCSKPMDLRTESIPFIFPDAVILISRTQETLQ